MKFYKKLFKYEIYYLKAKDVNFTFNVQEITMINIKHKIYVKNEYLLKYLKYNLNNPLQILF